MLRCAVYKRYHIIFSTYSSSSATCVFRKRSFIILTSHFGHVTSYELKKTRIKLHTLENSRLKLIIREDFKCLGSSETQFLINFKRHREA